MKILLLSLCLLAPLAAYAEDEAIRVSSVAAPAAEPEKKPEPVAEKPAPKPLAPPAKPAVATPGSEAEWAFLKEAGEDPSEDVRNAVLEDMRLFADKYPESPAAPETLLLAGGVLAQQGDAQAAAGTWLRLMHEYPQARAVVQARAAYLELADRKFSKKLKPVLGALATGSENPERAERLALLVWSLEQNAGEALYAPAVAHARRFQTLYPGHAKGDRVQWALAQLHAKNGKNHEALAAFRKLLAVFERSEFRAKAQAAIAGLYADQFRDYRRAVKAYQELVEVYPTSDQVPIALERSAQLLDDKLKQYDASIQLHEKIISLLPKSAASLKAYQEEARLQRERMGLPDDAVKTYKRLAAEFGAPEGVAALLKAAETARKDLKNYKLEVDLRRKLAADYAETREAPEQLFAAAEILESDLKDPEAALSAYKEVAEKFSAHKIAKKALEKAAKLEKKPS